MYVQRGSIENEHCQINEFFCILGYIEEKAVGTRYKITSNVHVCIEGANNNKKATFLTAFRCCLHNPFGGSNNI